MEHVPKPGTDACRIARSSFTNSAIPLGRFDTEHVALLAPERMRCPCGGGWHDHRADRRQEGCVILADGTRLGRMGHIFMDLVNIREVQILQRVPGELSYRAVRSQHYGLEDEAEFLYETRVRVGEAARVNLE